MTPALLHGPWRPAAAALLLALAAAAAQAADSAPSPSLATDRLGPARALIAQQRWPAAIDELRRLGDSGSADWHNLMGYALRKNQPPDYAAAERHYDEALRLNPQHRGALEYSGELYLLTGRLPLAEARLATLDKACLLPCEEYADLKQAIARHKAKP
jgi:Flp pilus assembly protein TadD